MDESFSQTKLTADATLSEIVTTCSDAGELLEAIGLKPADYRNQTLRSACRQLKWSENEVLNWLKKQCSTENESVPQKTRAKTLKDWTEYILSKYHEKNRALVKAIKRDFPRVHQIHGNQYPWLKNMQWQFNRFEEALKMYYRFEEQKFFPSLTKIENADSDVLYGFMKKVERGIEIVQKDQKRIHDFMKKMRVDSNRFENPGNACTTLRIMNQNFKTLFENVYKQFKLEQEQVLPVAQKQMETVY